MAKILGQTVRFHMLNGIREGSDGHQDQKLTHIRPKFDRGPQDSVFDAKTIEWQTPNTSGEDRAYIDQDGEVTFSLTVEGDTMVDLIGFDFFGDTAGNDYRGEGEFTEVETVSLTEGDTLNFTISGIRIELDEEGE